GLNEGHVEYRGACADALVRLGAGAVPDLTKALDSKEARVPSEALAVLGRIGPAAEGAVPRLEAALKGPNGYLRVLAAEALWRIARPPDALPTLRALLDRQAAGKAGVEGAEYFDTTAAVRALGRLGPDAWPALDDLKKRRAARKISDADTAVALWQIEGS